MTICSLNSSIAHNIDCVSNVTREKSLNSKTFF